MIVKCCSCKAPLKLPKRLVNDPDKVVCGACDEQSRTKRPNRYLPNSGVRRHYPNRHEVGDQQFEDQFQFVSLNMTW